MLDVRSAQVLDRRLEGGEGDNHLVVHTVVRYEIIFSCLCNKLCNSREIFVQTGDVLDEDPGTANEGMVDRRWGEMRVV